MHGFSIADRVATDRSTFDPEQQQEQEEYGFVDAFGVAAAELFAASGEGDR